MNTKWLVSLLALLLLGWGAWSYFSGRGLVTLNFTDAPLEKVLASFSRQADTDVVTDLAPSTKVTIDVKRVTPAEALDIIAARTDSGWRSACLTAPDRAAIDGILAAFRSGGDTSAWTSYGAGGFGMFGPAAALDLRFARWTPSGSGDLHAQLDEASQKTGIFAAAPADWKPAAAAPKAGPVGEAIHQLAQKAGGVYRDVFLLRGGRAGGAQDAGPGDGGGGRGGGGSWIGSRPVAAQANAGAPRRSPMDPAGAAERAQAQIALLPAAEQADAQRDLDTMKKLWAEVSALPEEERRAKMREFFSSPDMQDRMEQRRSAREAKMTPEQRMERARNYFERKMGKTQGAQP